MGYQQGAFALGYVGDQQNPLAVLRGTNETVRVVSEFSDSNESFQTFIEKIPSS